MGLNDAPKGKSEGKGLTPMGWVKMIAAGTLLVGGPIYLARQYFADHHESSAERSYQNVPGEVLGIESIEGEPDMKAVTVRFADMTQTVPMPLEQARRFHEHEQVEVSFTVAPGSGPDELRVQIDVIAPVETDSQPNF